MSVAINPQIPVGTETTWEQSAFINPFLATRYQHLTPLLAYDVLMNTWGVDNRIRKAFTKVKVFIQHQGLVSTKYEDILLPT